MSNYQGERAGAEVVPSSSFVEIKVEVGVGVEVEVEDGVEVEVEVQLRSNLDAT